MDLNGPTDVTSVVPAGGMLIPGSPEWWREYLLQKLFVRRQLTKLYDDYFAGRHELNFVSGKFREVFGQMLAAVCDNWMPTVVKARTERLRVLGFRIGDAETTDGPTDTAQTDKDAWTIWQRNYLDTDFPLALNESSKHGESYLLVWPDDANPDLARITPEHPAQMIVERSGGDHRKRLAALKHWREPTGGEFTTLWLPNFVHRWQRTDRGEWQYRLSDAQFENPLGIVPVVPIVNDPQLVPCGAPNAAIARGIPRHLSVGLGRSDLADVISTQDEINKYVCDMLVASEAQAFIQRWATGLEVEEDDQGKPVSPFKSGPQHLWISEDEKTKFGQFSATELKNFTVAIESRVQSMASRTRVPMHYLLGNAGNFPSGESLKATETGLVVVQKDKQTPAGESAEESLRIAFEIEGNQKAKAMVDSETVWADVESRTESEHVDALVKKLSIGVPVQQLWKDAGYTPKEISEFRQMLQEQAQLSGVLNLPGAGDQGVPNQPSPPAPAAGGTSPAPVVIG